MKERIRIAASVVDNYRWNRHGGEDRLSILTKEAKAELAKLVENLKRIKPRNHRLWTADLVVLGRCS